MQAIVCKFLPATNTKPARIKAECERGSTTISFCNQVDPALTAVRALVTKFAREDKARYGTAGVNPWCQPMVRGFIPDGREVFVYVKNGTFHP